MDENFDSHSCPSEVNRLFGHVYVRVLHTIRNGLLYMAQIVTLIDFGRTWMPMVERLNDLILVAQIICFDIDKTK